MSVERQIGSTCDGAPSLALPGPSRRITVEPVEVPATEPVETPATEPATDPEREPSPDREPEKTPA